MLDSDKIRFLNSGLSFDTTLNSINELFVDVKVYKLMQNYPIPKGDAKDNYGKKLPLGIK